LATSYIERPFINSKFDGQVPAPTKLDKDDEAVLQTIMLKVEQAALELEACWLQSAVNTLIGISRVGNQYLNTKEPWNLMKTDREKAGTIFNVAVQVVKALAVVSEPFIPQTAEQIWQTLKLEGKANTEKWNDSLNQSKPDTNSQANTLFHKVETEEAKFDEQLLLIRENGFQPK
jgi:methionyl-tRNA synthetase